MKPILYSYFRSSSAYRVRIALHLKEIDFEYRPVHLVKDGGEQYLDEFKQLNPKSEVPFLIHDQVQLTQSMAILHYLDKVKASPGLFPKDSYEKCIELCELINAGIQPIQNLKVLQQLSQRFGATQEQKEEWIRYWISEGFRALEVHLQQTSGQYCLGDEVSAVDLLLVPQAYNAKRYRLDLGLFPLIQKIEKRCQLLQAFHKAHPDQQPDSISA